MLELLLTPYILYIIYQWHPTCTFVIAFSYPTFSRHTLGAYSHPTFYVYLWHHVDIHLRILHFPAIFNVLLLSPDILCITDTLHDIFLRIFYFPAIPKTLSQHQVQMLPQLQPCMQPSMMHACEQFLKGALLCVAECVAVCCSVLQCVAVCCSVLQCEAVCCSALKGAWLCVAVCCSVSQCVAVCCMCCSV